MQYSETVIAAMIGAIATMSTALFQLYSALRSRGKFDVRPKQKGRTVKSVVSVVALMIASGVGGYVYSEMRHQRAADDIRSMMRDELNAKFQSLLAPGQSVAASNGAAAQAIAANGANSNSNVESIVYAPACQGGACSESNAQRLTLCGAMPSTMEVRKVELFAKAADAQTTWEQAAANFEQDIGGAKFTGVPAEHAQDETHKAVCVDFMHWSAEPHLARVVLQYGASVTKESDSSQQSPHAVASTPSSPLPNTHIASMTQPGATP